MFQGVFQPRDARDNAGMEPPPARPISDASASDMELDAVVGPFLAGGGDPDEIAALLDAVARS